VLLDAASSVKVSLVGATIHRAEYREVIRRVAWIDELRSVIGRAERTGSKQEALDGLRTLHRFVLDFETDPSQKTQASNMIADEIKRLEREDRPTPMT
jgi:cob(I)alamin adenosyltransferase